MNVYYRIYFNQGHTTIVMTEQSRARDWFLTINNPSEEEIELLKQTEHEFCAIGREVGHKCGTEHIHCLIKFKE